MHRMLTTNTCRSSDVPVDTTHCLYLSNRALLAIDSSALPCGLPYLTVAMPFPLHISHACGDDNWTKDTKNISREDASAFLCNWGWLANSSEMIVAASKCCAASL
jgi:hypothetical protein